MKKILSLLLLTITITASAQHYAGIGQGVSRWRIKDGIGIGSLKYPSGGHFSWDKALYYKTSFYKKLWLQTSFRYNKLENSVFVRDYVLKATYQNYFLSFEVQYDVTYPLLHYMFPNMQDFRSFIGFSAMPVLSHSRYEYLNIKKEETKLYCYTGFHYTQNIPLAKNIWILSRLNFQVRPFSKYIIGYKDILLPNRIISWESGILLRL